MKVLVIEDEINVRKGFVKMLNAFCKDVEVVGVADSVESGLQLIQSTTFDVLFLDINLPDGSGFDLMYRLPKIHFKLIFVTAYDKYAVDAFKLSAVDYLLKPVAPDLLQKAVDKARISIQSNDRLVSIDTLRSNQSEKDKSKRKIILKDQDSLHLILIEEIIYCFAEGSYTNFVLDKTSLNFCKTSSNDTPCSSANSVEIPCIFSAS